MKSRLVVLLALSMVMVSLSGCLSRGGGNSGGNGNMGSPEEVSAEDYNVLYIGHSLGENLLKHYRIMHMTQDSQTMRSTSK